jgi:hypothetical protein
MKYEGIQKNSKIIRMYNNYKNGIMKKLIPGIIGAKSDSFQLQRDTRD